MIFDPILTIFVFLFGTIVGSFLNVVILRYATDSSALTGRSRCRSCSKLIRWFENIPIISYLFLRGRCSGCNSLLSVQYPLVELATGILFLAVWLHQLAIYNLPSATYQLQPLTYNLFTVTNHAVPLITSTLFYLVVFSLLVVVFVYDFYHKNIPHHISYTLAVLGLGFALAVFLAGEASWTQLAAGPLLFVPFWALWYFSNGTWMGLGDGKLVLGMGWILGLSGGFSAVVLAFWIGAVVAIGLLILQYFEGAKLPFTSVKLTTKSEIPFGPFLIIGFSLVYFFGLNLSYLFLL